MRCVFVFDVDGCKETAEGICEISRCKRYDAGEGWSASYLRDGWKWLVSVTAHLVQRMEAGMRRFIQAVSQHVRASERASEVATQPSTWAMPRPSGKSTSHQARG